MLFYHLSIGSSCFALQLLRASEFNQLALAHHHDLVWISEGRQTMGNRKYRTTFELLRNDLLDYWVVPGVDIRSGLVDQYNFAVL